MPTPARNWKLVWPDKFNTPHLNPTNWNRQVELAGRFNQKWQRCSDDEKNAYIKNGQLIIKAIGGEWSGRPDETTVFPQTMTIDWIRVYQAEEE